ncbi:hypothetical protein SARAHDANIELLE_37 [Hafnia phage vB_HpaM_SarahDanielle]|uniref:Uncharacterized protein n=1 Tax=Hafnia phage vB_HpaM_SarahDanielle TaxID=2836113 RepID=A0AAE8BC34_9CAUD|nr:hypothetical protein SARAHDANIELLE_37 [Hafnia phage vB_HpaM_SarahDanielle]
MENYYILVSKGSIVGKRVVKVYHARKYGNMPYVYLSHGQWGWISLEMLKEIGEDFLIIKKPYFNGCKDVKKVKVFKEKKGWWKDELYED